MRLKLRKAYLIARQRTLNGITPQDASLIAAEMFGLNYREKLIIQRELERKRK